jgi:acyl-CoA hydrolase/RimJ/RimL family protein N-acetyltransferase
MVSGGNWEAAFAAKRLDRASAIRLIAKGQHVFLGSGAAEPLGLVEELVAQADEFADNTIVHLLTLGPAPYVEAVYADKFRHNAVFIGPNVREAVHDGRADYTPVFLSQIPALIRSRRVPIDVALIQVTPPDRYGYVNLGVSVDVVLAAVEAAELVIAEVNPHMPVVHGAGFIPVDLIDAWVETDRPLPELEHEPPDAVADEIGRLVASLIGDGSTLQLGIGQLPNAVLAHLGDRKDLGIWSEMFSDGVVELIESGNITGRYKSMHPNKVTASFTFGSEKIYRFVDRNPMFEFHPSDVTNNPVLVAQQHRMVAINSALQVDLTGQVCADSIGDRFYSGIGGQVDFIRGAAMCSGGKPIIALRSTAKGGDASRIVATLDRGAGVVTSRGDVRFVVTEYGIADLQGRSIRERVLSLSSIAHPDFRAGLLDEAKARHYVFPDQIVSAKRYPSELEKTVETARGSVLVRPIRVTDEQKMKDLFYELSEEAKYKRWMTVMKRMPHRQMLHYLDVDYEERMALVVETQPEDGESEVVGVARYHVDRATSFAEAAFVLRDDWQGQGLGAKLLSLLIEIARGRGIRGFTAEVLAENAAMLHVFHKSGLRIESSLSRGVYSLRMPFS